MGLRCICRHEEPMTGGSISRQTSLGFTTACFGSCVPFTTHSTEVSRGGTSAGLFLILESSSSASRLQESLLTLSPFCGEAQIFFKQLAFGKRGGSPPSSHATWHATSHQAGPKVGKTGAGISRARFVAGTSNAGKYGNGVEPSTACISAARSFSAARRPGSG